MNLYSNSKREFLQNLEQKNRLALSNFASPKKYLKAVLFEFNQEFVNSANIETLVAARALLLDKLIVDFLQKHQIDLNKIVVFAVGGYGRCELHPYSDLDLLFFIREDLDANLEENLKIFISSLWDLDLKISHTFIAKKHIYNQARDISLFTSWLEARQISPQGDYLQEFLQELQKAWNFTDFVDAKIEEQNLRYKKFSTPFYLLEPNIKNSSGALRDVHTINWIFLKLTGISLFDLNEKNFELLSKDENFDQWKKFANLEFFHKKNILHFAKKLKNLRAGLWQIRYALHFLNDRGEDRILFDYQKELAKILGFEKLPNKYSARNFKETRLIKHTFGIMSQIQFMNEIFLQNFTEKNKRANYAEKTQIKTKKTPKKNKNIFINSNKEAKISTGALAKKPSLILELFNLLSKGEVDNLEPATWLYLMQSFEFINKEFLQNTKNQKLFLQIFNGTQVYKTLRLMSLSGFLEKYIKDFGRLKGIMQYDLAHIYSVDWHLLHCVENIEYFTKSASLDEFPLEFEIIKKQKNKGHLYLAALFHDIGKGLGGSHAQKGKQIFLKFAKRHSSFLSKKDTDLISFLIEEHLLASETAQKQDLSEIKFIAAFVEKVNTKTKLDCLYLLTVADISATNPKLWNSWRAALLKQLYWSAQNFLKNGKVLLNAEKQIKQTREEALKLLAKNNIDEKSALNLWRELGDDYFSNLQAWEAFVQTSAILQNEKNTGNSKNSKNSKKPLALTYILENGFEQSTKLFIYTDDKPYIFAQIVNCLQSLNLNILEARILTANNSKVLDTFVISEKDTEQPKEDWRLEQIKIQVLETLKSSAGNSVKSLPEIHLSRRDKHYQTKSSLKLVFDKKINKFILEVKTKDKNGILAKIANTFVDYNLNLHHAKITTLAGKVEDVFYLSTKTNFCQTEQKNFLKDIEKKLDNF